MRANQFAHQRHDAGDDLVLAVVAIGEEGIVGDIDEMRVRARSHDLAEHRESAKAGIEHQDRRGIGHVATLRAPWLPFGFWGGFAAGPFGTNLE
ncbi:hypothetical protein ACVWXN_001905 [Bradyrhizobium sp. i1.4.4]